MNYFHMIWHYVAKFLEATAISIEIALVGAVIAWLQLDYAKKRDATLDARNQWEKIDKAMLEFRFRREILNTAMGLTNADVIQAAHAVHMLRGELDRAPDSRLVTEISEYLSANKDTQQWRADAFVPGLDKLAHQVALKTR